MGKGLETGNVPERDMGTLRSSWSYGAQGPAEGSAASQQGENYGKCGGSPGPPEDGPFRGPLGGAQQRGGLPCGCPEPPAPSLNQAAPTSPSAWGGECRLRELRLQSLAHREEDS